MKEVKRLENDEIYAEMAMILAIANKAALKAKEENDRLGIPGTFWKNGKVYYILPDGDVTSERPAIMRRKS